MLYGEIDHPRPYRLVFYYVPIGTTQSDNLRNFWIIGALVKSGHRSFELSLSGS